MCSITLPPIFSGFNIAIAGSLCFTCNSFTPAAHITSATRMAQVQRDGVKFSPGQVIVKAKPLLYSVYADASHEYCGACFQPPDQIWPDQECPPELKECAGCHQFRYCGKKCQLFDWKKFHKYECKIYARHANKLQEDGLRIALRLASMLASRPEDLTRKFKLMDGSERAFQDMESHLEEIERDSKKSLSIHVKFTLLKLLGVPFDEQNLRVSFARAQFNSFTIQDTYLKRIGAGLYIEASIFDHSCRPNACPVFIGPEMQVRAIRPIESNEPVTVSYIDCKVSRSERQMKLQNRYYFTCQCVRCGQENDAQDDSVCRKIASIHKQLNELHSLHSGGQLHVPLYECSKLLGKMIPLYEKLYGEFHPDSTLLLVKCSEALSMSYFSGSGDEAIFHFGSLEPKLSRAILITHGKDHPLWHEFEDSYAPE